MFDTEDTDIFVVNMIVLLLSPSLYRAAAAAGLGETVVCRYINIVLYGLKCNPQLLSYVPILLYH